MKLNSCMYEHIEKNTEILKRYSEKLSLLYRNCYTNALDATFSIHSDGTCYLIAGDIPAMWLRDSSTQIWNYLKFVNEPEIAKLIKGMLVMQFRYIEIDAYANAFNEEPNGRGHTEDIPRNNPWVWERKYEIDSLGYPIRVLYHYWKKTEDESFVKEYFPKIMKIILQVWKTEQFHFEKSLYRFTRHNTEYIDTIHNNGMGEPVGYTGMTWQGFRPSDDACRYGYNIAGNIFAYICLGYAAEMLGVFGAEYKDLIDEIIVLRSQILDGVKKYGIVEHEKYGKIFAYETDGMGHFVLMDDANVPSLLSLPYIGFHEPEFEMIYQNTRRLILSKDNPFFYEGSAAKGIGSPHTGSDYIWHIGLSMQGLTSTDKEEMKEILEMLIATDADTGYMHEGFYKDDPYNFTRSFFPWSNSLFCEFVEKCIENGIV